MTRLFKIPIQISLFVSALLAQTPPSSPLARESQLEFAFLDAQQKEVTEKVQALADLLLNPIMAARSAAVVRACNLVGLAAFDAAGKPACQVKDGMVRQIGVPQPAATPLPTPPLPAPVVPAAVPTPAAPSDKAQQ